MKIVGILLILMLYPCIAFPGELKEGNGRMNHIVVPDSIRKHAEIATDNNQEFSKFSAPEAFTPTNQIKYTKEQIDGLMLLSQYYLTAEDYVKTLESYFQIIDIYDHGHDIGNLVKGYSMVIQFFLLIKDYGLAEKYLVMIARLVQKSSDPITHGLVFLNMGNYFKAKRDYDLSIRNLYLCIPYFQKAHDLKLEGAAYKYLGDAFVQKKMYAQAEYNYRKALSLSTRIPAPAEIAAISTRIAHINQVLGNNKLNLEFNLSAMRIREKISHSLISSSLLNVGEAYWLLGRKDSARYYMQKSLQLAEQNKNTYQLEAIYLQLSNFAKAEKRYPDALKYFMSCIDHRTKLNQDRNRSEILILEANRTITANEAHNDLLNQEILIQDLQIKNRRIQMFLFEVTIIIMLSFILVVDALSRKNRNRKNELNELNSRLKQEINIRIEAEGMLNRSEELHRFLAENTVDVISLIDAGMHRLYISPSCEKFYGYSAQEIIQMHSPLDLVSPSFHVAVNQYLLEMIRSKNSTRYIYKVLRKDGSTFWAEANINPILDPATNEVKNLITVVRDISERMKHEEELSENSRQKEYLLREIHNRVKNNFAILVSLMNMQHDQSSDPELSSSLTDLQLRVRTMSLVHEQLYQTQEISTIPFDSYLYHLALIISSSYSNSRICLQTELSPCKVAIEMALPLGLIINELLTNAFKYAFPGDRTGNIWVRLLPENEEKFCVSICDNGIGLPEDFTMNTTQSMGSQIIVILVEQIEARIEVSGNGGACFRILFSTAKEK